MLENSPAFSGFAADDIAAAKAFYADTLGVPVVESRGMLQLQLPGREVLVYPKPGHVPAEFTVLNFPVPDIEAAVDALVARGVTIQHHDWTDERGINRRGGPLIAWFTDPAGNVLSVLEQDDTDDGSDEAQVRGLVERRTQAQDAKDAAAVVALYAEHPVLFDLAPPLAIAADDGHAAGLQQWFDGFDGPMTFTTHDLEVAVSGDVAFVHGLSSMTATPPGAPAPFTLWFRSTLGLRKQDGAWTIVHEHKSVPFHMELHNYGFRAATDLEP